jgi:hypothetical protein
MELGVGVRAVQVRPVVSDRDSFSVEWQSSWLGYMSC